MHHALARLVPRSFLFSQFSCGAAGRAVQCSLGAPFSRTAKVTLFGTKQNRVEVASRKTAPISRALNSPGALGPAIIVSLILVLLNTPSMAEPLSGVRPPRVAAPFSTSAQDPGEVLREGIGKILYFLEGFGAGTTQDQLKSQFGPQLKLLLEQEVSRYFAFPYMARWAAGTKYRRMTDEQKRDVEDRLKEMLIGAMLRHLSDYREVDVEYLPPRRNRMRGVVLGIRVMQQNGSERSLEFHMFRAGQTMREGGHKDWKIVDVVSDGQSALAYYRWYFSRNP